MKNKKKPDKKKKEEPWKWTKKSKANKQEPCALIPEIKPQLNGTVSTMEIFELVTGLAELIDLMFAQTNLYAQQKGRNFTVDNNELNYIMAINKSPTIVEYWRVDNLIGNNLIQNTIIPNRFCEILQNRNFADNMYDDKTDRGFKVRPVIDHLIKNFSKLLPDDKVQSIDEHMEKFKGRSGMKQYIKSKPIKWDFQFWFKCSSKTGYLY